MVNHDSFTEFCWLYNSVVLLCWTRVISPMATRGLCHSVCCFGAFAEIIDAVVQPKFSNITLLLCSGYWLPAYLQGSEGQLLLFTSKPWLNPTQKVLMSHFLRALDPIIAAHSDFLNYEWQGEKRTPGLLLIVKGLKSCY